MAGEEILINGTSVDLGILAGVAVAAIGLLVIWAIALYVYFAIAMQSIGRKLGYKRPWFAWIPILNTVMLFQLGGFHWAWVLLGIGLLIPILNIFAGIALVVISIISYWRVFEKAGYAGALSLLMLVPIARMIMIGIVAWEKKEYKKKVVANKHSIVKPAVKRPASKKTTTKKTLAKKKSTRKK